MFQKWSHNPSQGSYAGVHEIAPTLPPGLYRLSVDPFGNPLAHTQPLRSDSICQFKNGPLNTTLMEIDAFWNAADHYKRLGVSHKRGFLLYGPPGCGKTGIISATINDAIRRQHAVFQFEDAEDFGSALTLTRQIEGQRPFLALIEDIEQYVRHHEESLLELLDGASSHCDHILFLATTNHLDKVPPRLRRCSRFDTLIEVALPPAELRQEYLSFLLDKDNRSREASHYAHEIATLTSNFSLADLKELVLAITVYRQPLAQTIKRIRDAQGVATAE